jgi:hypothetical protein
MCLHTNLNLFDIILLLAISVTLFEKPVKFLAPGLSVMHFEALDQFLKVQIFFEIFFPQFSVMACEFGVISKLINFFGVCNRLSLAFKNRILILKNRSDRCGRNLATHLDNKISENECLDYKLK